MGARLDRVFWQQQRVMALATARNTRIYENRRALEAELVEVRRTVERLAWAARLGSESARRRLRDLTFNIVGNEAAKLAGAALAEMEAERTQQIRRTA